MPTTVWQRSMIELAPYRRVNPTFVVNSTDWTVVGSWLASPPYVDNWSVALSVDADVDAGVVAELRMRSSDGTTSPEAAIASPARRIQLGFTDVPATDSTVFLEARRVSGIGGVKALRADGAGMTDVPAAQQGGPFYPPGYVSSIPTWTMNQPPVAATWTDESPAAETLTLNGSPVVTATEIQLLSGKSITRAPLPQPNDTFDVLFEASLPGLPANGDNFFTTKLSNAGDTQGVELYFVGTSGDMIGKISDGAASSITPIFSAAPLGVWVPVRVTKTLTELVVTVGSTTVTATRPSTVAAPGGSFTINGIHGNPSAAAADPWIRRVEIRGGF